MRSTIQTGTFSPIKDLRLEVVWLWTAIPSSQSARITSTADTKRPHKASKKITSKLHPIYVASSNIICFENFIGLFHEATIKLLPALDNPSPSKLPFTHAPLRSSNFKIRASTIWNVAGNNGEPDSSTSSYFRRCSRKLFSTRLAFSSTPKPPHPQVFPSSRDKKKNPNAERKSATPYRRHIRTNGPILLPLKNRNE